MGTLKDTRQIFLFIYTYAVLTFINRNLHSYLNKFPTYFQFCVCLCTFDL